MNYKTISVKERSREAMDIIIRMYIREGWSQESSIEFKGGYFRTVMRRVV